MSSKTREEDFDRPASWDRVPAHLRRFLVEQDYDAYDEIDQAVWRFTLHHAQRLLHDMAHPAYVSGLPDTGISLDRIPRLTEVDRKLGELGWGAVCVDGFIPPRAFFALQAERLLPIAAEIRSHEHLAYTPAPDIIHEAAGHAPLLAHSEYATFLCDIGRVGERALALPHDHAIYQAIYALSVVKERAGVTAAEIASSEQRLADAIAAVDGVSEAGLVARLYWWTVEYGLIGRVDDYRLFGAGLLSSLGEAFHCHGPEVHKLPLSARCIDVDYDITRAQPQLFVAESFAHLSAVLREVEAGLAQARGGIDGLAKACASGELATISLDGGLQVLGRVVQHSGAGESLWCRLQDACALARDDRLLAVPRLEHAFIGDLSTSFDRGAGRAPGSVVEFGLGAHERLRGRVASVWAAAGASDGVDGAAFVLAEAERCDSRGEREPLGEVFLVHGRRVERVCAGAVDRAYHAPSEPRGRHVPGPKLPSADRADLLSLYKQALAAWHGQLGPACVPLFARIHARLQQAHPNEWLLRWNLLESLLTLGERSRLTESLVTELVALERFYGGQQPIMTGLGSLAVDTSEVGRGP